MLERVIECHEHFNGNFVLVGKTGQRNVEGQCHRPGEPCAMYNRTLWEHYRERVCTGKAKEGRAKIERKVKQKRKAKEKSARKEKKKAKELSSKNRGKEGRSAKRKNAAKGLIG